MVGRESSLYGVLEKACVAGLGEVRLAKCRKLGGESSASHLVVGLLLVSAIHAPAAGWQAAGELLAVDPTFEAAKLVASEGPQSDELGYSVAVSGSTVVVGAPYDDDNGLSSGSALVFTEPVGGWSGTLTEVAKLVASDGGGGDEFGSTVAISGNTVVIGSLGDDDNGLGSGAAYVFTEPVGGWVGTLTESAKLLASDGAAGDAFGVSVGVSGTVVVVGSPNDELMGSAYVYVEPVGGWAGSLSETAKLLASDGAEDDDFGFAVAVSGSAVIVGAPFYYDAVAEGIGRAYVFAEPAGGWAGPVTESAILVASDGSAFDHIGLSVAASGSSVVVGSPGTDRDNEVDQGSAYLFAGGRLGRDSHRVRQVSGI